MGELSASAECLRFMIYTTNLLMVICSFALIVLCGFCLGYHEMFIEMLGENTAWIIIGVVMVIAVITFLVALLGCCGAMKENTCMLKTYIGILLTLLLTFIVVGGLAYGFKEPVRAHVYDHMKDKMIAYNPDDSDSTVTSFWNNMQQSWIHCCGIDNATDWSEYSKYYMSNSTSGMSIPEVSNSTNGKQFPDSCIDPVNKDEAYPQGCLDKTEYWLHSNMWMIVGIIGGCAAAMILAMCCVCCLVRSVNQYEVFEPEHNRVSSRWR